MKTVGFVVGVGFEGPVIAGTYHVNGAQIDVSYPQEVQLGFPSPIYMPAGASTVFTVAWPDSAGLTASQIKGDGPERHLPIYQALSFISEMLVAFKLNRIGHSDGIRIKTVGIADTLFYFPLIDGLHAGGLNLGIKLKRSVYPWLSQEDDIDPHGTTALSLQHIGADDYQMARRYVRCFELLDHGYFNEAIIVSHSILDDTIQIVLNKLLEERGLQEAKGRKQLLRGIKENRHEVYFGPLLKITAGITIDEVWGGASKAVAWLNTVRNGIAHSGGLGQRSDACKAIFVSLQTVAGLGKRSLIDAEIPWSMLRHARLLAAWTLSPPDWVPSNEEIEGDPFS